MYSDKFISNYNRSFYDNILDNNISLNINSTNVDDMSAYFAFQHFVLKALSNGYKTDKCMKYLSSFYKDFRDHPHLFCDSPLLKNGVIDKFVPEHVRANLKAYRDKYYSLSDATALANKPSLTEEEKNKYYAYLIVMLRQGKKETEKILEEEVKKLVNKEMSSLNDMELKFLGYYVNRFAKEKNVFDSAVLICSDKTPGYIQTYGMESAGIVRLNRAVIPKLSKFVQTACHETRHSVQGIEVKEKKNRTALEVAQRRLGYFYLDTDSYNSYRENYRYTGIELDAEKMGYFNGGVFFRVFGRPDLADEVFQDKVNNFMKRDYYEFMYGLDKNGNKVAFSLNEFMVVKISEIIKNHPEELKNYPVLTEFYNQDGSLKPFVEILAKRLNQTIDNRGTFDDYINYGIKTNKLNDYPLANARGDDTNKYILSLGSVFTDYTYTLKEYLNDDRNSEYEKQVVFSTNDLLTRCYNVLEYVNTNFNALFSTYVTGNPKHKRAMMDFFIDLRDLDLNNIKNEVIKNNPDLMNKLNYIKGQTNKFITFYNKKYVEERLAPLSKEVLSADINTPFGTMNFSDYFKNVILPNMDGHMEVMINGSKYYVGDLIRGHAKEIEEGMGTRT